MKTTGEEARDAYHEAHFLVEAEAILVNLASSIPREDRRRMVLDQLIERVNYQHDIASNNLYNIFDELDNPDAAQQTNITDITPGKREQK